MHNSIYLYYTQVWYKYKRKILWWVIYDDCWCWRRISFLWDTIFRLTRFTALWWDARFVLWLQSSFNICIWGLMTSIYIYGLNVSLIIYLNCGGWYIDDRLADAKYEIGFESWRMIDCINLFMFWDWYTICPFANAFN